MNYKEEQRIIMTLDAGGTNFVFSAIAGGKEIVEPFVLPSVPTHIDHCLKNIVTGFHHILKLLPETPVAMRQELLAIYPTFRPFEAELL